MPGQNKWIQRAVKPASKGKFTAKAAKAGKSVAAFAQEKKSAPGKIGKEARLAITLRGMKK